jgi:dynein heavy chain
MKDFVTMKSYNQPPAPIKLVLESVCIMLGVPPKMIEVAAKSGKAGATMKVPDYWEKSKKLLNEPKKFILSLENYAKDNIPDDRIVKIQDYLNNPKFVPEEIKKASSAAEGMCKWVRAICKYDIVAKEIRPKREALA